MKSLILKKSKIEILLYCLIWLLIFSIPYFRERNSEFPNWQKILNDFTNLSGYLIVSTINMFYLVPKLLFSKKYLKYFSINVTLVIIIIIINLLLMPKRPSPQDFQRSLLNENLRLDMVLSYSKPPLMKIVDNVIIFVLVIGASTSTKLISKWLSEEKLRKDIEKEQLKTNLALLRHQVSPHFFMNTLNNIHALIDINSEDAKDAIIRLSTLMRYLLYDSAQSHINLKKEIEFINSFISLMKLRFSDKVEIIIIFPEQIPNIQIPPMLFISFLENAFKHGISYQSKSFIYFELKLQEKSLYCIVKNSKHNNNKPQFDEYAGIGLENIKKSLKLLYNEDFKLNISDKDNEFEINLTVPL